MRFKSIAVWPVGTMKNKYGEPESSDKHYSKSGAEAVCRMLHNNGFGGMGKVFPVSTRVEEIKQNKNSEVQG